MLVIGAEVFTRILDWQDRSTCVLFGDGAGAVVLQPTDQPGGLLSFVLGSDGSGACSLYVPAGGSRRRPRPKRSPSARITSRCRVATCFGSPRASCPSRSLQALEAAGLTTDDIDLLIPHQANVRIIDAAGAAAQARAESAVFANVEHYGNTSAASIPVALCEAIDEGLVQAGSTVVMSGFGAGLSWGTAVWKWHGPD